MKEDLIVVVVLLGIIICLLTVMGMVLDSKIEGNRKRLDRIEHVLQLKEKP